MRVMPYVPLEKLQFLTDRKEAWTTNAVAIGTTVAAVNSLDTLVEAAYTAYDAQQAAQATAKTATQAFKQAMEKVNLAAGTIVDQIRVAAKLNGNGVYTLAQLPEPATPGPIGPLGTARDFECSLGIDGSLTIKFKCTNPAGASGTVYQVWRKPVGGELEYLGGVGGKVFVDTTLPAGVTSLVYQIQAVRSTSVGAFAQFNVNFGAGGMTVTPLQPRIAA